MLSGIDSCFFSSYHFVFIVEVRPSSSEGLWGGACSYLCDDRYFVVVIFLKLLFEGDPLFCKTVHAPRATGKLEYPFVFALYQIRKLQDTSRVFVTH